MLEIGNGGMSPTEYRTHFSLWCMLAAPLMAGNDLRLMSDDTREILTNRDVIAIDQDGLGREATRAFAKDGFEVWTRPLQDGTIAVGVFNRSHKAQTASFSWAEAGLPARAMGVRDLWRHADLPVSEGFSALVPAHGCVVLKVTLVGRREIAPMGWGHFRHGAPAAHRALIPPPLAHGPCRTPSLGPAGPRPRDPPEGGPAALP